MADLGGGGGGVCWWIVGDLGSSSKVHTYVKWLGISRLNFPSNWRSKARSVGQF